MVDPEQLVKLASFATIFEAERALVTLEHAGVPAILQPHGSNSLFGAGPVPGGLVVLLVRQRDVDRAWELVITKAV